MRHTQTSLVSILPVSIAIAALGLSASAGEDLAVIRHVDLVHFSHTDYGYTDHPAVCRDMQRRYLDVALDAILATRGRPAAQRFAWTAETTVAVRDWWQAADPQRRRALVDAVEAGQLAVGALPLNNTATLDGRQWQMMLDWLPADLWRQLHPQVALQSDVNGCPRAGAAALLDRGVRFLFMSSNDYCGGPPFPRPTAFWWKMPDGRRILVYLNYTYPAGYDFFEAAEWRRGPVPRAGDARYRPPRPGEIFADDEPAVRRAHQRLVARLTQLEKHGYTAPRLILSTTNQWRIDNDPPFPPLADFVATWDRLGLRPTLRLTTVAAALRDFEQASGPRLPEHTGAWPDWWANGVVSTPREVAASRRAKRLLAAAASPLLGPADAGFQRAAREILEDLCLFDEHTWGSTDSVGAPYDLDVLGQFAAKAEYAYRPAARAEWLLGQRLRTRLADAGEGLYLLNLTKLPWSGWAEITATALRQDYRSVEDVDSGRRMPLEFVAGYRPWVRPASPAELSPQNTSATYPDQTPRQTARFWVAGLPPEHVQRFRLATASAGETGSQQPVPDVTVDAHGWPLTATWPDMPRPLFLSGTGDLAVFRIGGFAPRWALVDLWANRRPDVAEKFRRERLEETTAAATAPTAVHDNPHTRLYVQALQHPRLLWAERRLELWKNEPRARVTLRFHRTSGEQPEALVARFDLPTQEALPRAACGGEPFEPFVDQLPGTCRDYFAVDGTLHYPTPAGDWYWTSHDCPLVAFGSPPLLAFHRERPRDVSRVQAILYNNFWNTNFHADMPGVMEFRFDLLWTRPHALAVTLTEVNDSLTLVPPILLQPGSKEQPSMIQRLYQP